MTADTTTLSFEDAVEKSKGYETLGPAYFLARQFAEKLMSGASVEPFEKVIKKYSDDLYGQLLDSFQEFLLENTESNIQSHIYQTVDRIVFAILAGNQWAVERYVTGKYHDHKNVREQLAKLIPSEIQNGRIADLEQQVADLQERLKWSVR